MITRLCLLMFPLALAAAAEPVAIPGGATADATMLHGVMLEDDALAKPQEVLLDLGPVQLPRPGGAPLVVMSGARAHALLTIDAKHARALFAIDHLTWVDADGTAKELAVHAYAVDRTATPLPGLPLAALPAAGDGVHAATGVVVVAAQPLTVIFVSERSISATAKIGAGSSSTVPADAAVPAGPTLVVPAGTVTTEMTITRAVVDKQRTEGVIVDVVLPVPAQEGRAATTQRIRFDAATLIGDSGLLEVRFTRATTTMPDGHEVTAPATGGLVDADGNLGIKGLAESLGFKPRTRGGALACFPVSGKQILVMSEAIRFQE
jgi:hypothetical protein